VADQLILTAKNNYQGLDQYFHYNNIKKILLVCGYSIKRFPINEYFLSLRDRLNIDVERFSNFQPNPLYESVVEGVDLLRKEKCDLIIAVGGGSAMDVAKCIKLYSNMEPDDGTTEKNYLNQRIVPNDLKLLAVPTTAGTGSEATRYAVIYYGGAKQSVTDFSIIPSAVLMDPSVLKSLPIYQKKSTMMDALCHAIESFWSVNSTEKSIKYSKEAIQSILANMDAYLNNEDTGNENMLIAANTAGKAINVTQTTAGHAMCYKITSLFRIAHGHAAALCDRVLFPWMVKNTDKSVDPRGKDYVRRTLDEIGQALDCKDAEAGAEKLNKIFCSLQLEIPKATAEQYEILKISVNPVRLKNHPIALDTDTIDQLYHDILKETL